nr:HD domain-containing protein [Pseudomonadota bacterium]
MSEVNPHYLDHVVKLSETSDIEASEDIVSGTGMKLLAKGAKIDARARERLLEFRLNKPLENMMRVVGGTDPSLFHPLAEQLLARHALLRGICATVPGFDPIAVLKALELPDNVQSLLSVYAGQATSRLEHAVGVAVITSALGGSVSANPADTSALVIAALTHDIGELYIDPAFLSRGVRLTSRQWKHVATHPIVGAHVLGAMPGAGPRIASVVLAHHERLDGFGYPQGTLGSSQSMAGQMLAVAEMLMGLMESGAHQAQRAAVAMRLVPGEFHRRFIDRVMQGARDGGPAEDPDPRSFDVFSLET